ncbi:hypothetical protein H4R33_000434 [Dimargaris cristalligena]|nr:hypothetical protein H4R33_000434 [Dimargaris cristalligena]
MIEIVYGMDVDTLDLSKSISATKKLDAFEIKAIAQGSGVLKKDAYRFIDLTELWKLDPAKQLPFLALVDFATNPEDIVNLFYDLVNRSFDFLVHRDWAKQFPALKYGDGPLSDLVKQFQLKNLRLEAGFTYWDMFESVTAIIMAWLALTEKFDYMDFLVKNIQRAGKHYANGAVRKQTTKNLEAAGIMLLAMTEQGNRIDNMLYFFSFIGPDESKAINDPKPSVVDCSIIGEMRQLGLIKGADYLEKTKECKNSEDSAKYFAGKIANPDFAPLRQLRLLEEVDKPCMSVPVMISEFDANTKSQLADLGPWEHDTYWKLGQSFADNHSHKYWMIGNSVDKDTEDVNLATGQSPDDAHKNAPTTDGIWYTELNPDLQ